MPTGVSETPPTQVFVRKTADVNGRKTVASNSTVKCIGETNGTCRTNKPRWEIPATPGVEVMLGTSMNNSAINPGFGYSLLVLAPVQ